MTSKQLVSINKAKIKALCFKYGVNSIRLFGSVARGDQSANSDFDFLVSFDKGRSLMDLVGLKQDLEKLLKRNVDVVTENSLHWYIRDQVLKEAVGL